MVEIALLIEIAPFHGKKEVEFPGAIKENHVEFPWSWFLASEFPRCAAKLSFLWNFQG